MSGAFKLEFACEFLSKNAPQHYLLSFAMIVYAAYSLDRGVKNREDIETSKKFRPSLLASSSFCMVTPLIISQKIMLLIPFAVSYLYSRGVKNLRLKSGKGVKNVVVAFTWAFCIALFLDEFSLQVLIVCIFFFLKSFINTVLYDFKDVERDKLAGICTLPACMDTFRFRTFLLFTNFLALFLISGVGLNHTAIMSLANGTFYILRYSKEKRPSNLLVDGEWIIYRLTEPFWLYFYSG